jgi:hypothetical protein
MVDGKVWQPEEHGTDVQISVKDLNGNLSTEDVDILHVKADLMEKDGTLSEEAVEKTIQDLSEGSVATEKIAANTEDGAISFGTTPVLRTNTKTCTCAAIPCCLRVIATAFVSTLYTV